MAPWHLSSPVIHNTYCTLASGLVTRSCQVADTVPAVAVLNYTVLAEVSRILVAKYCSAS